jgi:hypothetical protein
MTTLDLKSLRVRDGSTWIQYFILRALRVSHHITCLRVVCVCTQLYVRPSKHMSLAAAWHLCEIAVIQVSGCCQWRLKEFVFCCLMVAWVMRAMVIIHAGLCAIYFSIWAATHMRERSHVLVSRNKLFTGGILDRSRGFSIMIICVIKWHKLLGQLQD